MIMITGGAFQGKAAYARQKYPDTEWKNASDLTEKEIFASEGVLDLQEYIRSALSEGKDLTNFAEKLCRNNPGLIFTCQEVGSGVVPIERQDREFREITGRICTSLAAFSEEVVRIVCGIPVRIKG